MWSKVFVTGLSNLEQVAIILMDTQGDFDSKIAVRDCATVKICVFWVVTPCGSCKNRRFGGTWRLLHQGDKNW
jgi:hypothetical protein